MNAYFLSIENNTYVVENLENKEKHREENRNDLNFPTPKLTISNIFLYIHTLISLSFWIMLYNKHLFSFVSLLNLKHFFVLLIILQKCDFKC